MVAFVSAAPLMGRPAFVGAQVEGAPSPVSATVTMKASKALPFMEAPSTLKEDQYGCTFWLQRRGVRGVARRVGVGCRRWKPDGQEEQLFATTRDLMHGGCGAVVELVSDIPSCLFSMLFLFTVTSSGLGWVDFGFDPLKLSSWLDQDWAAKGELKSTLTSARDLCQGRWSTPRLGSYWVCEGTGDERELWAAFQPVDTTLTSSRWLCLFWFELGRRSRGDAGLRRLDGF